MKNILVPIDFSDGSRKALQYAVHFAKQFSARITLVHVLTHGTAADDPFDSEYFNVLAKGGALAETARKLKAWAEEFVAGEVQIQIHISQGSEAIEIVNMAKKTMAGLMVISTHGRTGRAHALAGSLAESLVHLAPCPVLVVREHERDFIETDAVKNQTKGAHNFIGMAI